MIIRIVKLSFHAEYISNFKTIFEENKQKIISQKGCNRIEMLEDINEVNVIFTYSWWDYEDDLNNYRKVYCSYHFVPNCSSPNTDLSFQYIRFRATQRKSRLGSNNRILHRVNFPCWRIRINRFICF